MGIKLSTGYLVTVSRKVDWDNETKVYTYSHMTLMGHDGFTSTTLLELDPKSALELAADLIRSATLGMVK